MRFRAFLGSVLFVFLLVSQTSQQASGAFTISYSNVVENQTLSGIYKVVVVASDIRQVSNIKLYIDGVFLKTETSSPYEFSIATTNYADGNRVLKAVATDKFGNTNAAQVTVSVLFDNIAGPDPPASTIIMYDTTKSSGWGIYSTRPVMAEYVTSSSVLVGKNIDSITVNLKKSSSSATGTAQIGIINSNLSIKKLFATLSISTLTTASKPYEFKLPSGETYLIQAGDRIGVKYTGGTSSSNYLTIMRDTDTSGPFDGTKTHLTYYTTSWAMSGSTLNHDLTMTLKYSGGGDTTPPTITAPAAIITEATGQLTLVSLGSPTVSDLVDSTPVVTNDAPSGGFPVGTTTVTWTATDDSGNSNTATQSITISDTIAPTLTAPAAITAEATGALTSVSLGSPTVSDTADPSLSVTNDAPSGGFPVGTTTVTWTATDDSGNSVTATQTVTITDTTPPTVTASPGGGNYNSAQLITLASNEAGTTIYYTLDGTSPTTSSFEYSSAISISTTTTTVMFFGVDAAGNFGSVVAETYTIDTTAPTVTAFPQGGTYGSIQSVTLTSDEDGTIIYYTTNGFDPTDSSAVYSSPIELSTNIVLKFFGKDASGNSADVQSETYSISLPDTTPPSVVASPSGGVFGPSGVSVTLGADEQAVVIYYTTDDSDPTETSDQYSDTPILITTTTNLRFFGKDMSGNSGSIVTEIYNIDSTAPPKELRLDVYAVKPANASPEQTALQLEAFELANDYMTRPDDLLIFQKNFISYFPGITYGVGGASLAQVTSSSTNNPASYIIGYDLEHWTSSPQAEQDDPVGSSSRAADIAHNPSNPHKFAYNPDGLFLIDNRVNPPIEWYKQYDYAKFDHLWMQLQNSNRFTVADMIKVMEEARIKNPSIVIFAHLSLVYDDVPTIISKTQAIKDAVDGVIYFFTSDQSKCPRCTIENLTAILEALRPTA